MRKKLILIISSCIAVLVASLVIMVCNGVIIINNPSEDKYPIRGIDVSEYQGEIDWQLLSEQGIDFVFIKSTEGSGYTDSFFNYNFAEAKKENLAVGVYHFFSYDSTGKNQAEHFINTVGDDFGTLPPVVDIEFYGDYYKTPPSKENVTPQFNEFLYEIENYYGVKPIIYATQRSYKLFISEEYNDYPIWIRDVFTTPVLPDGKEWTFWQYSDKAVLPGYKGEERFIDVNVFNGNNNNFKEFLK